MEDVGQTKDRIVNAILANEVYMPGSGMMSRLKERLMGLSKDDLASLKLIIEVKLREERTRIDLGA